MGGSAFTSYLAAGPLVSGNQFAMSVDDLRSLMSDRGPIYFEGPEQDSDYGIERCVHRLIHH